jgi:hypothetical protein
MLCCALPILSAAITANKTIPVEDGRKFAVEALGLCDPVLWFSVLHAMH